MRPVCTCRNSDTVESSAARLTSRTVPQSPFSRSGHHRPNTPLSDIPPARSRLRGHPRRGIRTSMPPASRHISGCLDYFSRMFIHLSPCALRGVRGLLHPNVYPHHDPKERFPGPLGQLPQQACQAWEPREGASRSAIGGAKNLSMALPHAWSSPVQHVRQRYVSPVHRRRPTSSKEASRTGHSRDHPSGTR